MVDLSYSSSVQAEGPPGRAFPRLPEEVPGSAFGGEIGRAVEGAGEAEQQHVDSVMQQARTTQLTDAHNQLQSLSLGLTHDPQTGAFTKQGKDAFGITPQYLDQYDQAAQKIVSGVPDPRARQAALLASGQVRDHLAEQLDTHELQQHQQFGVETAKASVNLAQQTAIANYNNPSILATNLDGMHASIENLAHQQGWSDEQTKETTQNADAQFHSGVFDHMVADGKTQMAAAYLSANKDGFGKYYPEANKVVQAQQDKQTADGIVTAYRTGGISAGIKAQGDLDKNQNITDEQKDDIRQHLEKGLSEWRQEQTQKYGKDIEGVEERIASGNPADNDRAQIWKLYQNGVYTAEQTGSLIGHLEKAQLDQAQDRAFQQSIVDAYKDGKPLDPKDKDTQEAVDGMFGGITKGMPPGSNLWTNRAADIANKTGVVPSSVIDWSRTSLVGGPPQQAAQAALALDRLEAASPRGIGFAMDDKTKAMSSSIVAAINSGTDPETAVNLARHNSNLPKAEQEALEFQWKQLKPDATAVNDLKSFYQAQPGQAEGLIFKSVPDIPPLMSGQYNDLVNQYYRYNGGDLKTAKGQAQRDMQHQWAVSSVNGTREFMQYAPEAQGFTTDEIRNDLNETLKGVVDDPSKAKLVPSAVTEETSGRRFTICKPDQFGCYDTLLGNDGRPREYELPDGQAAFAARAQKLGQEGMDRARAKQAAERQSESFLQSSLEEQAPEM